MKLGHKIGQRLGEAQYNCAKDLERWMDEAWCWLTEPNPMPGKNWVQETLFWVILVAFLGFVYLWSSSECAMGRECLIANADLANWLFGIK